MDIKLELQKYLEYNLKELGKERCIYKQAKNILFEEESLESADYNWNKKVNINDYLNKEKDDNLFQKLLFKYIDARNLKDSDVYNKVNIDRRLFSKIRNNEEYHPSKDTIILLAIALNLSEIELEELLNSASYSLPRNNVFDLIIRFCFANKIYDINIVNELLYDHSCKTLN